MIKLLTLENSAEWDGLVRSFPDYDTYWLSGYVKAFQLHGDGEPLLFYYENKDVKQRGINVVMKRDIADAPQFAGQLEKGRYFDFSTPYGYGGWLLDDPENEGTDTLFDEYERCCQRGNIVSEFVRFHPLLKNHTAAEPFYQVIPLGEVVAVDLSAPEMIWNNFTSQNRNKIRKAIKGGVKIYQGRYPEIYEAFRNIYDQTMDKDHAINYYYFEPAFYESILNDLPENAQIFYAQIPDGTIIAASIMLTANGRMNYHLSGSLREYNALAPVNLLLYQVALWGCANGCRTLYLGGGVGSGEDSLLQFKRSFYKGDLERFCIGRHVFDTEVYQTLVDIRKKDNALIEKSSFFPVYRAPATGGMT